MNVKRRLKKAIHASTLSLLLVTSCWMGGCELGSPGSQQSRNQEGSPIDYQALATEICSCAEPAIEMNKKLFRLRRESYQDNWNELIAEAETLGKEAVACCKEIKEGLSSGELEESRLRETLITHCEEMPELLFSEILDQLTEK
jgi:hypothetical protein